MGFPRRHVEYAMQVTSPLAFNRKYTLGEVPMPSLSLRLCVCITSLLSLLLFSLCHKPNDHTVTNCFCFLSQETQSTNVERLIAWLLDHSNLEVPDLESTAKETPPTPPTTVATETPSSRGEAVMVYESSSDSSGSSDVDVVDVEGKLVFNYL